MKKAFLKMKNKKKIAEITTIEERRINVTKGVEKENIYVSSKKHKKN